MLPSIGYNQQVKRAGPATNTDNKHHSTPKREATRSNYEMHLWHACASSSKLITHIWRQ